MDFEHAHQTMKILKDLYYEKLNIAPKPELKQVQENPFREEPTKHDFDVLNDIIIQIVVYLSMFNSFSDEELIEAFPTQEDLAKFLLADMNLQELNPFFDKLLALTLKLLLNKYHDFSDTVKTTERLAEFFGLILNAGNNVKSQYVSSDRENTKAIKPEIDVSVLELGMVVKNYKELCKLLGQPVKNGKSKKIQVEDFKRYFDFEMSGQKYIITDIFDEPLTKEDRRKLGNNSIYVNYIELILLQYLSQQSGYTKTFTKRNWWELLGMVNKKYNRIAPKQLQDIDYKITPFQINNFYQRCNKRLEQILFSALNNLKNRKLIIWELQTVIVRTDDKRKEQYFLADDEDKKRILEAERHVLKNVMNYEKMFQVYISNRQNEYYSLVNEILHDSYGWNHYFKQIKLIYTPQHIQETVQESEINLQKKILNEKIIRTLNDNAKDNYDKEVQRWEDECKQLTGRIEIWGHYNEECLPRKWLPDTYVEAQRILTEELINIGHQKNRYVLDHFEEDDELNQIFNSFIC